MFIFITLDNNHREIWERSGRATFSSHYESATIATEINEKIIHNPYAIGMYRSKRDLPQDHSPSLLRIRKAFFIPSRRNRDIFVYFDFLQKLPSEVNRILNGMHIGPTPLIQEIYNDAEILSIAGISLPA